MAILDYFTDEKDVSVQIDRTDNNAFNSVTGKFTTGSSTIATVNAIFYIGPQAERLLAEKLRSTASGVVIMDIGTDVKIKDELTINSIKYNVMYVDNVSYQGEALVLAITEKL